MTGVLAVSYLLRVWLRGKAPACKAVYTGSNPVTRSSNQAYGPTTTRSSQTAVISAELSSPMASRSTCAASARSASPS